jgi:hypothetical protein
MSNNWVIIYRSHSISNIAVLESLFNAHEIPYRLRDQHISGSGVGYIHAFGGIKLEVPERYTEVAKELVMFAGYKPVEKTVQSNFFHQIGIYTSKIPLFNQLALEKRILLLATIISLIIAFGIYAILG